MKLLFQEKITGEEKRLVLPLDGETKIDEFALNMMGRNEIDNLISTQLVQVDASHYLQFDVAGMDTLSGKMRKVLKKREAVQILNSVIGAFEETEAYMLSEEGLLLDLNYVFVDEKNKCRFLYLPFQQEFAADRMSFLRELVEQIRPDYLEKETYLFDLLNAFSRGAVKKVSDFKEILWKNSNPAGNVEKENEPCQAVEEKEASHITGDNDSAKAQDKSKVPVSGGEPVSDEKKTAGPAILNIPGKNNMAFNIPAKSGIKSGTEEKGPQKEKSKKPEKKKPQKKLWGKKTSNKKESEKRHGEGAEKVGSPGVEIRENKRNPSADDMYVSYEHTVMMEKPLTAKADADETVCLNASEPIAELVRKKTGEHIPITRPYTVLGSGNTADCRIADNRAISRMHAVINRRDGAFFIADNHSSNGTWVDDRRLMEREEVEIPHNTQIKLADEEFLFKLR